jgi:hypothetical protein
MDNKKTGFFSVWTREEKMTGAKWITGSILFILISWQFDPALTLAFILWGLVGLGWGLILMSEENN